MRSKAHLQSHPIHPMVVALPIGLWVGAVAFYLLAAAGLDARLDEAGFFCTVGGCVGAALAAVPGVIDLFGAIPRKSSARNRGYIHGLLNTVALLVFIAVAWRQGGPAGAVDGLTLGLALAGIIGVVASGWLGGTLVYRNQIGVDRRYANATELKERSFDDFSKPICNQGELSEGQLMLVQIGGERIAVGKCADGIFAFADECTHRGGPLSDGALVGCTVQCPWHGSQFDCKTGRVVAGPAEEKIKTYEVATRNGEVYIQNPRENEPRKAA